MLVKLRLLAGENFWGALLDCFYCLSLLLSLPLALWIGTSGTERALLWPALSAGAILLGRMTSRDPAPPLADYRLENEESHDVLQRKENDKAGDPRRLARRR